MPTTVKKAVVKTAARSAVATASASKTSAPKTHAPRGTVAVAAKPAPAPAPEPEIVYEEPQVQEEEVSEVQTGAIEDSDDIIRTPTQKIPPPTPTAHLAVIEGFERADFDSGSVALVARLRFEDNDKEDKFTIFVPALLVTNFLEVVEDPERLPEEEGDKERGIKSNKQFSQYLRNIANGDKTAVMQVLGAIAKEQGRTRTSLGIDTLPEDFDSWVDMTATVLTGVRVIALCRPDRNAEGPFANMLRVQDVKNPSILDDPKTAKALKRYALAWE